MTNGAAPGGTNGISGNGPPPDDLFPCVDRPRIVSLDDEAEILVLMRFVIEKAGYEFWGTDDEAEAMCLLCFAERVDLFTQDLERPAGAGGCQILSWQRSHPKLRRIPMLIVSGYPYPWARQLLENAALDVDAATLGFLQKPFTSEQLSQSIRAMFARRRRGSGFAGPPSDEALAS